MNVNKGDNEINNFIIGTESLSGFGSSSMQSKEKMPVRSETITDAVNQIIPQYIAYEIGSEFSSSKLGRNENKINMQTDKLMQIDMSVQLWDAALHSALRDTTDTKYPHYHSIQAVINYILNKHNYTDFGLCAEVLSRLLSLHCPGNSSMVPYYRHIVEGHFAQINDAREEDQAFFWVIVDQVHILHPCLEQFVHYNPHPPPETPTAMEASDHLLATISTLGVKSKKSNVVNLDPVEKEKRSSICLKFLCDILEADMRAWLQDYEMSKRKPRRRTLLACLIWPDVQLEGHVTAALLKIIALQRHGLNGVSAVSVVCERLLAITAELVRSFDRMKNRTYPFLGTASSAFARELGLILLQHLKEQPSMDLMLYINRVKPAWLRLMTVCQVLGDLAGFQCLPELSSAVTVMEHLEQVYKVGRHHKRLKENVEVASVDQTLVAKFGKLKSVNSLFRTGLSRLHAACYDNNVEAVRALLTFPTLDLNLTDPSGWTALHVAASRGSEACVRELLAYTPRLGGVQRRVDTRACGPNNYTPLMRAVEAANTSICSLLLKHTGSVLLEDITDNNETALDLCNSDSVRRVLMQYKSNYVETMYSRKEMNLATGNLPLVAALCGCLIQSYMCVHRTWDVYQAVKRSHRSTNQVAPRVLCDYLRYFRDFKTNLAKLRIMVMKLLKVPELECITELHCIVSLNKV